MDNNAASTTNTATINHGSYICAICGKKWQTIAGRNSCENACLKKQEEERIKKVAELEAEKKRLKEEADKLKQEEKEKSRKKDYNKVKDAYRDADKLYEEYVDKYKEESINILDVFELLFG